MRRWVAWCQPPMASSHDFSQSSDCCGGTNVRGQGQCCSGPSAGDADTEFPVVELEEVPYPESLSFPGCNQLATKWLVVVFERWCDRDRERLDRQWWD